MEKFSFTKVVKRLFAFQWKCPDCGAWRFIDCACDPDQ